MVAADVLAQHGARPSSVSMLDKDNDMCTTKCFVLAMISYHFMERMVYISVLKWAAG